MKYTYFALKTNYCILYASETTFAQFMRNLFIEG